jgi:hypothetical protein
VSVSLRQAWRKLDHMIEWGIDEGWEQKAEEDLGAKGYAYEDRREESRKRRRLCGRAGARARRGDDQLHHDVGLRHHRGVGGRDLLDRRLRPLSHKALRRRRDRLVLGAEQIPRWDRLLRRGSRRRGERPGAPRAQCGRHYPRGVGVDVTGEGGGKRALVEIQIHAVRAVRVRNWHFPQRGRNEAALVQLKELTDALSFVQSPPWDPLPVLSMFSPCVGLACPVGQPIPVRGDRSAFLAHAVAQ